MIRNYFHTALRQFGKNRSSSLINVFGLAFGIACCMFCYVHIRYEYSFDGFHQNKDRIFRITTADPALSDTWVKASAPIPPRLKSEIPEIEGFIRLNSVSWNEKVTVQANNQVFLESNFLMADPEFFDVFSFPLLQGDASTVLKSPNSVVISRSTATKLFGETDALGKLIRLKDSNLDFQVSGVMQDLPSNTHLQCDYLISFENLENVFGKGRKDAWGEFNYFCYLILHKDADPATVQGKMQAVTVKLPGGYEPSFANFRLQPIQDIHFQHSRGNILPSYDKKYIYIFLTLALTVLVITTMNYFNLATMMSLRRIKEIGVRKSIGATRVQLFSQFISENVASVLLSLALAVILLETVKPIARMIMNSPLDIKYSDPQFIIMIVGSVVALGLASGTYLSFFVTTSRTSVVPKHAPGKSKSGSLIQSTLIFMQFGLSLALISASIVISRQMNFISDKDLGFDQEQVINVALSQDMTSLQLTTLKEELRATPGVSAVGSSDFTPGRANWNQTVWWEGQTEPVSMYIIAIAADFIPAMRIKVAEGELEELKTDPTYSLVINEAAREQIGWEAARGRKFSPFGEANKKPIAAVVKDFNFTSLHNAIAPMVFVVYKERKFSKLVVRLEGDNVRQSIDRVGEIFHKVSGGLPFDFTFMDDTIDQLYKAEKQMSLIVSTLTVIAVAFALLGIYTLISFSIESRTKEIAIRKVLGINAAGLFALFSTSYFRLSLVAAVVALPVCWGVMNEWLNRFSYRIPLNPLWFALALGVLVLSIAAIAFVKYLAVGKIQPAQSLKYE